MSVWRASQILHHVPGSWKSSQTLTRIYGCLSTLEPSSNTVTATTTRSLSARSYPPLGSPELPVLSAIHTRRSLLSSTPTNLKPSCGIHTRHPLVSSTLLAPKICCVNITRGKRRKEGKKNYYETQDKDDDTDDDEEEMELESGSDFRELKVKVSSLRIDAILKAGLNMSRNKVESAFYASKIRLNEEKVLKKSQQCHEGDEVDVVKSVSNQNPRNMYVARVVIVALSDESEDEEKITVKLRRYHNLLIETYQDYKPSDDED